MKLNHSLISLCCWCSTGICGRTGGGGIKTGFLSMGSAVGAVGRGWLVPAGARGSEVPEVPLDPPPTDGTSPLAVASRP